MIDKFNFAGLCHEIHRLEIFFWQNLSRCRYKFNQFEEFRQYNYGSVPDRESCTYKTNGRWLLASTKNFYEVFDPSPLDLFEIKPKSAGSSFLDAALKHFKVVKLIKFTLRRHFQFTENPDKIQKSSINVLSRPQSVFVRWEIYNRNQCLKQWRNSPTTRLSALSKLDSTFSDP